MDVLIVEPYKELALVLAEALARKEISTTIALTAQEAIERADSSSPKVVVLELLMPKHNGLEFIHELRSYEDWTDLPIIVYSNLSRGDLGTSTEALQDLGIRKYFYKPTTSLEALIASVEEQLS